MKCEIDTLTAYYDLYCAADAAAPVTYADEPTPLPRRGLSRVRSILTRWAAELSPDRRWPHLPPAERLLRAYHLAFTIPRPLLLHYFPDHNTIAATITAEFQMTDYELPPSHLLDLLELYPEAASYVPSR